MAKYMQPEAIRTIMRALLDIVKKEQFHEGYVGTDEEAFVELLIMYFPQQESIDKIIFGLSGTQIPRTGRTKENEIKEKEEIKTPESRKEAVGPEGGEQKKKEELMEGQQKEKDVSPTQSRPELARDSETEKTGQEKT